MPCGAMCAFGTLRIKNVIASVAWQSPGRAPCHKPHARYCIMGPNGILCTRWEKEYASVRQTFVACDDCLVKNEAYDAEEKAHTNKRVSIIACNNVISKAQLSGTPRDTLYFWGKGVCKHKTVDCRLRQSTGQKRSIRRISRKGYEIAYKYGLFIKLSKGHSC